MDDSLRYKWDIDITNRNSTYGLMSDFIPDGVILDIGCACGDFGKALKKHKNCTLCGLEYDQGSIEHALATNAYEEVRQCDLNILNLEDYSKWHNFFDCLVLGDILEHLREPETVLNKLKKFLKPRGTFVMSIPNNAHMSLKASLLCNDWVYTEVGLLDKTHVHLFTYRTIIQMLSACDLEVDGLKWTIVSRYGTQPKPYMDELDWFLQKTVLEDKHSYVFQYIISCKQSSKAEKKLSEFNFKKVNDAVQAMTLPAV